MLGTNRTVDISTSAFFQHVLNQLDSLVFVKDQEGRIVYVNEAFEDFIGQPKVNYLGKLTTDIFESDAHYERANRQDQEVLQAPDGYTLQSDENYVARPGVYMRLTKRKFIFRGESFLLGLLVDISDLKNSEQKLKKSHQELESKIDHIRRTETKLIESEKMASIGHLTAGLAHEIGNPINYVAGSVLPIKRDFTDLKDQLFKLKQARRHGDELQTQKVLDHLLEDSYFSSLDDISTLLHHIEEGSNRVKNLLESLKSFSKNSESETSLTDINQLINHTLKLLSHTVASGVSIATILDDKLPKVYTNAGQLAQVLMHLIKNALQSLQGYGRVLISSSFSKNILIIKVKDDGVGMTEEIQKKMFEPFFTTREVGMGTGLGLSISWSIITQMGGQIEVESKLDKGSTVTISLPVEC